MAKAAAAANRASAQAAADARAERELTDDINQAIARTDQEVFTDALGAEPVVDDEGGKDESLEGMGDGLEGDELDDEGEEGEAEGEEAPGDESEGDEGEETDEAGEAEGEEGEPPPRQRAAEQDDRRQQPPSIPPRVLREQRQQAREESNLLRAEILNLRGELNQLRQMGPQPAPQTQQPPAQARSTEPPDMFADPAGWHRWNEEQTQRRIEQAVTKVRTDIQMESRQQAESRLNANLERWGRSPRSYEFNTAYRDLLTLERNADSARLVQEITASPDPGKAILDWWETSSNPEYIEYHRNVVRQAYGAPSRDSGQRYSGRQQSARREFRLPPTLGDAVGGNSQHQANPEMYDDSEPSVFDFGTRR